MKKWKDLTIQIIDFEVMEDSKEMSEIEKFDLENREGIQQAAKRIPPWSKQITIRGIVASFVIGIIYSVIVMKLNLTTGLVPSLNVSAALLAFVFLRTWTQLLQKIGFVSKPFTPQENTVVQTCALLVIALLWEVGGFDFVNLAELCFIFVYYVFFSWVVGGFGSYLLGLSKKTYEQAGVDTDGNIPGSYKEPGIGWMTGFLFIVSFVGLLALVPLRKIMIIDYKLTYPSGTATAVLINGFHTPQGDKMARKQVHGFVKFFTLSFVWAFF
ncbi:metal-nicotianamine transporter YSL3-like isoform X1 [Tasmannia lanceolata]|uniref:metal-nicotianamine transporter YSL3-like isoform X1 n=1 Tax=Tasmannia lanceolata TaxID=3420 RepID=UPI0040634A01